jgi:hypothetical protein
VTLGTIFNTESGDLLARITTAAAAAAHQVIVATGEHVHPADLGTQPPHVTIHPSSTSNRSWPPAPP